MFRFLKKIVVEFIDWFIYKLLKTKHKELISKKLTQKQKETLKRMINLGSKRQALRKIEQIRFHLYNLGLAERGLAELEKMYHQTSDAYLKKLAAWELALWYANQYNREAAQRCLTFLSTFERYETDPDFIRRITVLKAECYDLLDRKDKGKHLITSALKKDKHVDLYLAAANLASAPAERLNWINMSFERFGMGSLSVKLSPNRSLYDCLSVDKERLKMHRLPEDYPTVTVIMPVFNAEDVIRTSLESVLGQTWIRLEVFVVDDCSTDSTRHIVEDYAARDSRVRLIKAESNRGSYVSRNLALREATGDYVTINDADDWSHPEKIEIQARHLMKNPKVIGNLSQQARATNELKFYRRGKPGIYMFSNMSSFMFRRKPVLQKVGFWDSVRFGADSEYIKRIKKVFGDKAVVELQTGPLSFQRQSEMSLTGHSAFGFPGFFMGARKEYAEAHEYFHKRTKNLRYDFPQKARPFPVPASMMPVRKNRHFDVVIATDFRLSTEMLMSSIEEIKAQKRLRLRSGLIQMSCFDLHAPKKMNPAVRDLIDGDQVQTIVYGETVSCDLLVLRYPPILQEWQRYVPKVNAKNIFVIMDHLPQKSYRPPGELLYDIQRCSRHLQHYFGQPGIWYPTDPSIRAALHEFHSEELKTIHLSSEDWHPLMACSIAGRSE